MEGAPTFAQIAGDLADRLADGVPVAHNGRFDFAFIQAEYRRLGHELPWRWLCTLEFAASLRFSASRSLRACCENLGIPHDCGHGALVDARAVAERLLAFLLAAAYERELVPPVPPPLARQTMPPIAPTGRTLPRPTPAGERPPPPLRPHPPPSRRKRPPRRRSRRRLCLRRATRPGARGPDAEPGRGAGPVPAGALLGADGEAAQPHPPLLPEQPGRRGHADGVLLRAEHEDLRHFADLLGVERQAVLEKVAAALEGTGG